MIKDFKALEIKVGERIYRFLCEVDSPLGEVHDALIQMKGFVLKIMSDLQESSSPKTEECTECDKRGNMSVNNSQICLTAPELTAVMTGSFVTIGTLTEQPVIMIFDNQSTVAVAISTDDGATTWRTFPAGEALVLDLRGNHGIAGNFTFRIGTVFSGLGASGTFSISYVYAKNI